MILSELRFTFVKLVYADHNASRAVKKALKQVLDSLGEDELGLNVGAGTTRFSENIKNLDIFPGEHIDYVGKAEAIPVKDNFFGVVVTQETLEHVQDPFKAIEEIHRVLKPDGLLYCQLPFIIGYHPGPTDFWRFTKEGIIELVERVGFEVEECGTSVGPSTGFYRICIEYFAVLFSIFIPPLYHIVKGIAAILLYPLKWLDLLLNHSKQVDRIPGGYYIIARKKNV